MRQEVIQKAPEQAKKQTPNLTGIPTQMKLDFERRSGLSFDDVRVHYNSDKPRKIGALAYTQGNQVHVGPGQERHLRHELGHVVQQKQGIVRPTTWINGLPVNDSPGLEHDAVGISSNGISQTINRQVGLNANPLQFYRQETIRGLRGTISENRLFFLADDGTLYAEPTKIDEANTVLGRGGYYCTGDESQTLDGLQKVEVNYEESKERKSLRDASKSNAEFILEKIDFFAAPQLSVEKLLPGDDVEKYREICEQLDLRYDLSSEARQALCEYCKSIIAAADSRAFLPASCIDTARLFYPQFDEHSSATAGFSPQTGSVLEVIPKDFSDEFFTSHYATIIMTDGDDYITIEAFDSAVYLDTDNTILKLKYDHTWSFKLHGLKDGETFVDHCRDMFSSKAILDFSYYSPNTPAPDDDTGEPPSKRPRPDSSSRVAPSEKTEAPI